MSANYDEGPYQNWSAISFPDAGAVYYLLVGSKVYTTDALDGAWTEVTNGLADPLTFKQINTDLWFGGRSGAIVRYDGTDWDSWTLDEDYVFSIIEHDGVVHALSCSSSQGTVASYDPIGDAWTNLSGNVGGHQGTTERAAIASYGGELYSTRGGDLFVRKYSGSSWPVEYTSVYNFMHGGAYSDGTTFTYGIYETWEGNHVGYGTASPNDGTGVDHNGYVGWNGGVYTAALDYVGSPRKTRIVECKSAVSYLDFGEDQIWSLCDAGDHLMIAGDFTEISGVTCSLGLALWDGATVFPFTGSAPFPGAGKGLCGAFVQAG